MRFSSGEPIGPTGTFPRPAYGQVWSWEGCPPFMVLWPLGPGGPIGGQWWVIQLDYRTAEPYLMSGLYSDRDPIAGYTFIGGPTE
jgi:hypothetical protein